LAWRRRFPLKHRAHRRAQLAIKNGELIRASSCARCSKPTYTVAHHEDYRQPLAITWLCDVCHAIRHIELRRSLPKTRKKGGRPKKLLRAVNS
jgi:hypothetical protein